MPTLSIPCIHAEKPQTINASIEVTWNANAEFLRVEFHVKSSEPIRTHSDFPEGNWGLWEYDVVEVFLRPVGAKHYYEFQLSPLGQAFELEISEPRKKWDASYRSQFKGEVKILGEKEWTASFEIPLKAIGDAQSYEGNFCAILGSPQTRTYWSAFLPKTDQPDYHQPQHFKQIL